MIWTFSISLNLSRTHSVSTRWSFNTITIVAQLQHLVDDIHGLQNDGILNEGQAVALVTKLDGAIAKLNAGQSHAAVYRLRAFINQVESLRDEGVLPAAMADELIVAALEIVAQIEMYGP